MFLVALCLSIFLDAIQRFVEPQEVSNPRLVLIVGCLGLASNILGLLLFHEHGHSHGHGHGDIESAHGRRAGQVDTEAQESSNGLSKIADESGNIEDVLPQSAIGAFTSPQINKKGNMPTAEDDDNPPNKTSRGEHNRATTFEVDSSGSKARFGSPAHSQRRHRRHTSGSRSRYASVDDLYVHPASFRHEIIAASRLEHVESSPTAESDEDIPIEREDDLPSETSPLLRQSKSSGVAKAGNGNTVNNNSEQLHDNHNHRQPKKEATANSGHSHGDLNMRGVFLHVMGDALGNIGVILSALIIWLTDYSWRFYTDPLISLVITVIILISAIPLCRAASRILLQAVPAGLSIDEIKEDIEDLDGVVSCHHLHVWQLSDTKLVASLHVQVAFGYKGADSEQYMKLAKAVRRCLHEYGIHSSTIQPEFCLDDNHKHTTTSQNSSKMQAGTVTSTGVSTARDTSAVQGSSNASIRSLPDACLLDCDDECDSSKGCCAPAPANNNEGNSSQA